MDILLTFIVFFSFEQLVTGTFCGNYCPQGHYCNSYEDLNCDNGLYCYNNICCPQYAASGACNSCCPNDAFCKGTQCYDYTCTGGVGEPCGEGGCIYCTGGTVCIDDTCSVPPTQYPSVAPTLTPTHSPISTRHPTFQPSSQSTFQPSSHPIIAGNLTLQPPINQVLF